MDRAMQETGASGMNDMGPVMGRAMALAGDAPREGARPLVRERLK